MDEIRLKWKNRFLCEEGGCPPPKGFQWTSWWKYVFLVVVWHSWRSNKERWIIRFVFFLMVEYLAFSSRDSSSLLPIAEVTRSLTLSCTCILEPAKLRRLLVAERTSSICTEDACVIVSRSHFFANNAATNERYVLVGVKIRLGAILWCSKWVRDGNSSVAAECCLFGFSYCCDKHSYRDLHHMIQSLWF